MSGLGHLPLTATASSLDLACHDAHLHNSATKRTQQPPNNSPCTSAFFVIVEIDFGNRITAFLRPAESTKRRAIKLQLVPNKHCRHSKSSGGEESLENCYLYSADVGKQRNKP